MSLVTCRGTGIKIMLNLSAGSLEFICYCNISERVTGVEPQLAE